MGPPSQTPAGNTSSAQVGATHGRIVTNGPDGAGAAQIQPARRRGCYGKEATQKTGSQPPTENPRVAISDGEIVGGRSITRWGRRSGDNGETNPFGGSRAELVHRLTPVVGGCLSKCALFQKAGFYPADSAHAGGNKIPPYEAHSMTNADHGYRRDKKTDNGAAAGDINFERPLHLPAPGNSGGKGWGGVVSKRIPCSKLAPTLTPPGVPEGRG